MSNKTKARTFLQFAGMGKVRQGFDDFISENFIHHNQYFEGDRKTILKAMEEDHASNPNLSIEIKHCYEDGQFVITHSLVKKKDIDIVVVHIFRFEEDMITEMWDLGQIIDPLSPNKNGLF